MSAPAALAAVPGNGTPTPSGILTNPCQPNAMLAYTFDVGTLPVLAHDSHISIQLTQGALEYEFEELLLPANGSLLTLNLCVPGMLPLTPTNIEFRRQDVFESKYSQFLTQSF